MSIQSTVTSTTNQVTWKDVPIYLGFRASSEGKLETRWTEKISVGGLNGFAAGRLGRTWRPVKIFDYKGYDCICITKSASPTGKKILRGVHQLVCLAFHGIPPAGMTEVRHYPDYNRKNNNPNNLRWGTRADNAKDMQEHGRANRGEKCPTSKMTDEKVLELRRLRKLG